MKPLLALLPICLAASAVHGAPESLFDGKTLEGWEYDPKVWRVEDGTITGGSTTEKIKENHFISTKRSFSNFELRLKIKCSGDPATGMINSGIQVRSVRVPGGAHMSGYQIDCGKGWFGKIYDEFRRNRVIANPVDAKALDKVVDVYGWNEYRIRAEGPRIQAWINGVLAIDYTEQDKNIALDGQIGPQVHSGGACLVQVKDITIEELPPTPNAPTWQSLGGVEAARAKVAPPKKPAVTPAPAKPLKEGNAANSQPHTPKDELAAFKLADGLEAELVAAEAPGIGKFVPIAFDQRGALWTTTALEYPVDGNENAAAADALYASKAKDKVLVYDRDAGSPTGYASKPRIFSEGLAIPLGVLPYKNGCYVQHGHDIAFLEDTDADGKSDKRTVILTGFGVEDSHLFPHQFMRAPGGWIWMAQGLFNKSAVKTRDGKTIEFDMCRMAKFRPDGSQFEATSVGPNNIWGLALNGLGEAFIQEANDYGYPVMPFHEYAYYPGGAERLAKSYQPPFPHTADFRMGGSGLSGLALTDKAGPFPEAWRDVMLVANPITNRIQAIKMHRDGSRWRLEQKPDLLVSEDPWFRPVAITIGPDGCLYVVDWYNRIISHNEVPRNHPDRDKSRGRIWRVKAKAARPFDVPDLTALPSDGLIAKLGGESLTQSHLAWQALADRDDEHTIKTLRGLIFDETASTERRIQALWAFDAIAELEPPMVEALLDAKNDRNLLREALAAAPASLATEEADAQLDRDLLKSVARLSTHADPVVRAEVIRTLGKRGPAAIPHLLGCVQPPLSSPTAPSSRGGKPIKIAAAYDREFERFLVRMFLEQYPDAVMRFLDSEAAESLAVEARLLAALALEPKASAARVAKLLPALKRPPGQEEVLRLAQFPGEPGVGAALRAALENPATRTGIAEALLAARTRLDAAKLSALLGDTTRQLLASNDSGTLGLGAELAAGFRIGAVEPQLAALASKGNLLALRALRELESDRIELFDTLLTTSGDPQMRHEAVLALASSKAPDGADRVLKHWSQLPPTQQREVLDRLASRKAGAAKIVRAIQDRTIDREDLDGATVEKLQAVLGGSPELAKLLADLASHLRPVLTLDGTDEAWSETGLTLEGPFTIECWVRLGPGISNADGILGSPGQLDLNFHQSKFRVWAGPGIHDAIVSAKAITPELWTHVAATRDANGLFRLYHDGELAADRSRTVTAKFENVRIGWTGARPGTAGALSEIRIWNRVRTPEEIRRDFDRTFSADAKPPGLIFAGHGKPRSGAKIARTSDFPPVMSAADAAELDRKFSKYRALAQKPGDAARGRTAAMLCQACHLFKGQGGSIGPDLSGIGAMGDEAILRNLLTPNAAMEAGYRIFRVELKNGDLIDAFFVSEDPQAIVVRQPGVPDRRVPKAGIRSTRYLRRSLMPEGLLDALPPEQVSDLFAYLKSLR